MLQQAFLDGLREKYPHKYDPNEMCRIHGYGPEDRQCLNCAHHIIKRLSKDYHKCGVWHKPLTGGDRTDIRVRWRACGKFEEV
jgi:hypothetical protein